MTTASIILDLMAFFVPAALLVLVKRLLQRSKGTVLKNVAAYIYSFTAINWMLILLSQHWGLIKNEPIKFLLNKPYLSAKYLIAAAALSVVLPLAEHLIKYTVQHKLTPVYGRMGLSSETPVKNKSVKHRVKTAVMHILFLTLVLMSFGLVWLKNNFSNITVFEIVFTLSMSIGGTSKEMVYGFINRVIIPSAFFSFTEIYAVTRLTERFLVVRTARRASGDKKRVVFPVKARYILPFLAVWFILLFSYANQKLAIVSYLSSLVFKSGFIEEEYVTPNDVKITFPDKKRNLIYIYVESAESSVEDIASGGLFQKNCIPEMTELAKENVSFSESDQITGAYALPGCTVTMSGIIAQSAGTPLIIDNYITLYDSFLPHVVSLGDILEDEGYHNYFMCGSNLVFARRDKYFKQHGNYECFDYYSAIDEGKIDEDYFVWWGFEDKKLYQYAKEKITMLADSDQPFNFTMLTVDTHIVDGYVCDLCEDEFDRQYYNVYACASRQVCDFVRWIQEQDFYENTTVIICGDHISMDETNFVEIDNSKRRVYNCFINSAVEPVNEKNRQFSTLDFFPSTLAALGADIEGDQLGLGVNLFSDRQTLVEEYGYDYVSEQLKRRSDYYNENILN